VTGGGEQGDTAGTASAVTVGNNRAEKYAKKDVKFGAAPAQHQISPLFARDSG
jgi:hypothetical protein